MIKHIKDFLFDPQVGQTWSTRLNIKDPFSVKIICRTFFIIYYTYRENGNVYNRTVFTFRHIYRKEK